MDVWMWVCFGESRLSRIISTRQYKGELYLVADEHAELSWYTYNPYV